VIYHRKRRKKKEEIKNTEQKELLNPKIDYVFKRIFGHQENESIAKSFIGLF